MLFAIVGILKQPPLPHGYGFEGALTAHLSQNVLRIVHAGYLRGPDGEPVGFHGIIEAETFEAAQRFVESGPFAEGGHFDHLHLAAYDVEVGRVG